MSKNTDDIHEINEQIVRSVAKKVITYSDAEKMPYTEMVFSNQNAGYGFSLSDEGKFIAVRSLGGKLFVHISNQGSGYKKSITISEIKSWQLKTKGNIDSYKKRCQDACYDIVKIWMNTPRYKFPEIGDESLYKF